MVQRESIGDGKNFRLKYYGTYGTGESHKAIVTERTSSPIENKFKQVGKNIVIENEVRMFNTGNISLGESVYIGHGCFIDGYHEGPGLEIGDNCWIGPGCYIHAAGGIKIGKNTGIGPHVKMLTSYHDMHQTEKPVIENELKFEGIEIGEDCDIGMGAMLLPGAKIGRGCIVEAGAIVREDLSGCEERIIKMKDGRAEPHEARRVI